MAFSPDQLLGRAVRNRLVRLLRDHAGAFPGEEVLDLHSPGAFLATGLARESPRWTVHTGDEPEEPASNVEPVELDLPGLPFEDGSLALVTGAFLAAPADWSAELAAEIERVLVPKGRVLLVHRGPSLRAPGIEPTMPDDAGADLAEAGLGRVAESRLFFLMDGSEVLLLEATKGW